MFPVVAAMIHILEAALRQVAKPARGVALALHLVTLAVSQSVVLTAKVNNKIEASKQLF